LPKFQAEGIVEALEYDFNPWVPVKGIIAEPTDDQIIAFTAKGREMAVEAAEASDVENPDEATFTDLLNAMRRATDVGKLAEQVDAHAQMFADLCGGQPSKTDILGLPFRHRVQFYLWLAKEATNPEVAAPASRRPRRDLKSVAGGR
jgi:hypothetical protein